MTAENKVTATNGERLDDAREVYANALGLRVSATDLALIFIHAVGSQREEQVAVSLSPQTFKMVALTMLNVLEEYEGVLGEIRLAGQPRTDGNIRKALEGMLTS